MMLETYIYFTRPEINQLYAQTMGWVPTERVTVMWAEPGERVNFVSIPASQIPNTTIGIANPINNQDSPREASSKPRSSTTPDRTLTIEAIANNTNITPPSTKSQPIKTTTRTPQGDRPLVGHKMVFVTLSFTMPASLTAAVFLHSNQKRAPAIAIHLAVPTIHTISEIGSSWW